MMRSVAVLISLAACATSTDVDPGDTSAPECDRIHGAKGVVLLVDEVAHFPTEAPDQATATTSVAGPLDDGRYLAVAGGELLLSEDDGCNWTEPGSRLPATGDWDLVVQGATVHAFDRASSATATSTDGALSWAASDSGEAFLGAVAADPTVAGRLRGVQSRGVVTSEDGGTTWTAASGTPTATLVSGAVYGQDLETAAGAWSGGVMITRTGGQTWDEIGADLVEDGFVPGTVVFSTESPDTLWAIGTEVDTVVLYVTFDGGNTWTDAASSKGIDIEADARLWPVPGALSSVATAWGTTQDNYGINLYEIVAGDNIHTTHTTAYYHVHDVAFREDGAWIVGVDAIP